VLKREEAQRTGVYLLLGEDDAAIGSGANCYIGEADVVATRLRQHVKDKEFWDRVVIITSKDTNLTKSHGRYLEARLIDLAKRAARVTVVNGTDATLSKLPEADASDMEYFISQLQIVLPVLGVNAIRVRPTVVAASHDPQVSPLFRLRLPKTGVDASAQQIDGEFTMLEGSIVVPAWVATGSALSTQRSYEKYRVRHQALIADGSIVLENGIGLVTRDVVFPSPSTAGAVASGRSCNGRIEWVSTEGTTFGVWESRGVG